MHSRLQWEGGAILRFTASSSIYLGQARDAQGETETARDANRERILYYNAAYRQSWNYKGTAHRWTAWYTARRVHNENKPYDSHLELSLKIYSLTLLERKFNRSLKKNENIFTLKKKSSRFLLFSNEIPSKERNLIPKKRSGHFIPLEWILFQTNKISLQKNENFLSFDKNIR